MDQGPSEPQWGQPPQVPPPPPYHAPQQWYGPYTWGAPPASQPPQAPSATPRRRSIGRGLMKAGIGVGIAAGVAIAATLIASAATSPGRTRSTSNLPGASSTAQGALSSSGSSSSTSPPSSPGSRLGGPGRGFGMMGGPVIHGQFTIQGPNGYETLDERTGTLSSITNTSGSTWSLEVKSSDGTSAAFTVDSGTSVDGGEMGISSVKQGDTVTVLALDNNATATAKEVRDRTVLQNNASSWMPQPSQSSSSSSS